MGDYTKVLKKILRENGCAFERQGKGDHEIWYSPVTGIRFVVDNSIKSKHTANAVLKQAGLEKIKEAIKTANDILEIPALMNVMVNLVSEGMTMCVVTHEMGFARKVADRVLFMDMGKIVETGKPDEFFDNPQTHRAADFISKILTHWSFVGAQTVIEPDKGDG